MAPKSTSYSIVNSFFEAQFEVFDLFNAILAECKKDIEHAEDQRSHDLSKAIFKDLIGFETEFGEFDADLWNYVYDIGEYRATVSQKVVEDGLADHKEYFFRRIERCVSMVEDVVTEIKAAEYEWGDVDELLESVEKLFDASEAVIDVDPNELDDPEVVELVQQIPPQKLAPIEAIVGAVSIKRKPPSLSAIAKNRSTLEQARIALVEIIGDMNDDIQISNCDVRIKKICGRIFEEISKKNGNFSPIGFGINVEMMTSFSDIIIEEFGESSAAYFLSCISQCETFIRNFKAWNEYLQNARLSELPASADVMSIFISVIEHEIFDDDIRRATADLSRDQENIDSDNKKLRYAVFQSVSNVISVAIRESLKYISNIAKRSIAYVSSSIERTVGAVALTWVMYNYTRLIELAEKYDFFRWIKPVVDFIKRYSSV